MKVNRVAPVLNSESGPGACIDNGEMTDAPLLLPFGEHRPEVAQSAWLAPNATLVGRVSIGDHSSVFYGAVARGAGSNLQDNVVVHTDTGVPTIIGDGVSVGHAAVLHGCTIEDDCLIGMSATVLNRAIVGRGSLVAAGTVVLEGTVIPPGSLVAGVPGKVRRQLEPDELERVRQNAVRYVELSRAHRDAQA